MGQMRSVMGVTRTTIKGTEDLVGSAAETLFVKCPGTVYF